MEGWVDGADANEYDDAIPKELKEYENKSENSLYPWELVP